MFDATFWVAVSFVIFCLIIIYKKIPQIINNLLDNKINEIKSEIDNAKNLKIESENTIGAMALVTKNINTCNNTYIGIPAKGK